MGKHWAPDLQLPGSIATTEFKNPVTFCPGTICIVMAFPSSLITAGRKMKVILAKEIGIQGLSDSFLMWNKGNGISSLLVFVSFGYSDGKIFKLETVLHVHVQCWAQQPLNSSARAIGTISQVGKLNAWWLQCPRSQNQMTAQIQLSDSHCFTCIFTVGALIYL